MNQEKKRKLIAEQTKVFLSNPNNRIKFEPNKIDRDISKKSVFYDEDYEIEIQDKNIAAIAFQKIINNQKLL